MPYRRPIFVLLYALLGAAIVGSPGLAAATRGSLQVVVTDDIGAYVSNAHVYVYSGDDKRFIETKDTQGSALFQLAPGNYRVYSAITQRNGGYIDHYMSHEAWVTVPADDSSSVILRLEKTPVDVMYLSEYTRKKIGLDPELARYLN